MTTAIASKARILTDKSLPEQHISSWQAAMQAAVTDPKELLQHLQLDEQWLPDALRAAKLFPLRVPRSYLARIQKADPFDPLLRQVLPLAEEFHNPPGFVPDAVGDLASLRSPGLLQKYRGRALLITTGACAVHCRFCFRRAFPYGEQTAARKGWQDSLDLLAQDPSIEEVILSGGDPLSLSDHKLADLAQSLDAIPHLKRLRIHTRQPIVLPERVNHDLLAWLKEGRLQRVLVLHANHAQELDSFTSTAVKKLVATGVTVLNQAVLLRAVNDSVAALTALHQALFSLGVLPYYLHMLDQVQGAAHFAVPLSQARQLMRELAASQPGYLVPKLVREEMGKSNKSNVLW